MTRRLPFQQLLPRCVRKGATPFFGLLHTTLHPYLIIPSFKQGGIKYHIVFGMTRPGIEPRSPRPLANTLLSRPILTNTQKNQLFVRRKMYKCEGYSSKCQFYLFSKYIIPFDRFKDKIFMASSICLGVYR